MGFKKLKIGLIDRYIIGKFLSTYLGIVSMLVIVIIIFDMTEKMDDFMELGATTGEIILDYYTSFAPQLINRYSALITFIATVLFTSRMAYNTEIIAILSSGVSFKRLLYPYIISSIFIGLLSLGLDLYIIPKSYVVKNEFEAKYTRKGHRGNYEPQIYRQLTDDTFFSLKGYNNKSKSAELLVVETYDGATISKSLMARSVKFDTETLRWKAPKYIIRTYEGNRENLQKLENLDTMINLTSNEIGKVVKYAETLDINELNQFIKEQKAKGSDKIPEFEVLRQSRYAYPFAVIILAVIAVSLSSRKVRGGTGMHVALGLALCFSYIMLMQVSNEFGNSGALSPIIAVWMPNVLFAGIAIVLYHKAPK